MQEQEIELKINPDGTVESPWFTQDMRPYLQDLCKNCGTDKCVDKINIGNKTLTIGVCVNNNPYCG